MTSQTSTSALSPAPSESGQVIDNTAGFLLSGKFHANGNRASLFLGPLLGCLVLWMPMAVMAADPPPPPAPSQTTTVIGSTVTTSRGVEYVWGTVSDYNTPAGVAYVKTNTTPPGTTPTAAENIYLVKTVGQIFYPSAGADYYLIVGATTAGNVSLTRFYLPDGNDITFEGEDLENPVSTPLVQTTSSYNALSVTTGGTPGDPAVDPNPTVTGTGGVRIPSLGANGGNGHDGALFVPPASGKNGTKPADLTYTNTVNRTATGGIGIEALSIGGNGGNGGDAYLSPFGGKPGGTGGAGGDIDLTNATGVQVSATGAGKHGINAYSTSGKGGSGGDGYGAPSGGSGGGAYSGGDVTVTNRGNVFSDGLGAHGILATSRSGTGGSGGAQYGLFGEGGSGAIPGNGGKVTVTNALGARIQTSGDASHGISAMSLGGNGGAGGTSANLFASEAGAGGGGGNGDDVSVTNNGIIVTQGNYSRGIFAQSVGGGGGNGGFGLGLVALGGTGSLGGTAGEVDITSTGSISTSGVRSDGIFAQSVAGSGGSGGSVVGLVTFGGSAGPGGSGNEVRVENSGTIVTSQNLKRDSNGNIPSILVGQDASGKNVFSSQGGRGIVAQSIGGGGGDGGSATGMVSVGGSGGSGNKGGLVTVINSGEIQTHGDDATGIFAQSVGGGGGNGGSATAVGLFVAVGVGGKGGSGAHGGTVNVTLQGKSALDPSAIETDGMRSFGVFAQSVGGGGGNGGGSTAISAGVGGSVSVAVGGSGGTGGDGGNVMLDDGTGGKGNVTTGDDFSTGVFVQSVGGGGGNGGYATSVAVAGGPVGVSVAVGKGGPGGAGGTGGTVVVGHRASAGSPVTSWDGVGALTAGETGFSGKIWTKGAFSTGFIAQSVGGGGGNGGASVTVPVAVGAAGAAAIGVGVGGNAGEGSNGGLVRVGTAGDVWTEKEFSPGMLVQSVGGGGGNGGTSVVTAAAAGGGASGAVSVGIGGSGAKGSTGGDVFFATGKGLVWTKGESSTGMIAQSIGGGGGNGGFSVSGALAVAGGGAGAVSVGLGGEGGDGGESGTVTTHLQSDVRTEGFSSTGILVQAVGGGGGNGGYNVSASLAGAGGGAGAVSVGLGGNGGKASAGGVVNATSTGTIVTLGHSSSGFIAQSVGGGGGNGGFNVSAGAAGAGAAAGAVSVGLGGTGAGGGAGGKVTASTGDDTLRPTVTTLGDNSTGILAQSVGGGGGNGGFNVSVAVSGSGVAAGSVGVGLGGSGGGGGDGGEVDLTVRNNVTTGLVADGLTDVTGANTDRTGHYSPGVIAQSVGGGGGNGGFNVTAGIAGSGTVAGSVGVGLGGDGAMGGKSAAPVTLDMMGDITTRGDYAGGLIAQSVGGGGGNGGFNVSATISGAGTASGAVSVGLGGAAGGGGNATGRVTSSLIGNVNTQGAYSTGVTAQSLGGGGGNGGFNISGAISGAGTASGAVSVGLGGSGGSGGKSGNLVTDLVVDNTVIGDVTTQGANSGGVLAQSMGGGGGNGGFNVSATISGAGTGSGAVSVGIGGSGGDGGNAARVKNVVTGDIFTQGKDSNGVTAQSLGGGGGNGGFNVSGSISGAGTGSGAVSVGIGGSGGNGGHSGALVTAGTKGDGTVDVLLNNTTLAVDNAVTGNVMTSGVNSNGVVAQSIGGGGGNGGFSVAAVLSGAGTGSGGVAVGIGGSGGDGGHSGSVKNSVTGNVSTGERESVGVIAQSVGGGGGNGGFNVSGAITGSSKASGGVAVGIGGSGGGGGHSGNVDNTVIGDVWTTGADSGAVVAQSIGGGGGNGGFNIAGVISAGGTGSGAVSVGIGGSGGDGGNSGDVVNRVTGDVATTGDGSTAIMAQSVGGGGGNGGLNVTANINLSKESGGTLGVGVGGFGGAGGDAGNVTSTVNTAANNITITRGDNSSAVVAQSIGGGGGNGGVNVTGAVTLTGKTNASLGVGVGGFGGGGGEAGNVGATVTGNYVTTGYDSDGIVVQSLGGGGGNGGLNVTGQLNLSTGGNSGQASVGIGGFGGDGGSSGTATLVRTGDTMTSGGNSEAIIVQSLAGGGGNGGVNITAGLTASKSDNASLNFGLGGFGGDGSDADTVNATIIGNVSATGLGDGSALPNLFSGAVVAQSVGGGGGKGGLNVSGGVTLTKSGSSGKVATIGIGGFGGGGGDGGNVNLDIHAAGTDRVSVVANGDNRAGMIAQSLGGGGGLGGINVSGGISTNSALAFGMGGFGGDGGVSKAVTAEVTADIQVTGDGTRGLVAQSLGGGGGAGGINVSGTVNINSSDDTSLTFGLGGFGGTGNISGDVDVTQKGLIIVNGKDGIGILAQSVAGGGGDGGLNVSANIANAGSGKSTNRVIAGVGGSAGTGADAGDVTVNSIDAISIIGPASTSPADKAEDAQTTVFNSAGILAQSIGGGGGLGGMNISASVARNAGNTLQFGMGGSGGAGGNAGSVSVTRGYETTLAGELVDASTIQTTGDFSSGIVAQSVGGGGGSAGMNFNFTYNKESNPDDGKKYTAAIISVGGSGADAGDGDKVTVRHNGAINTDGIFSHGVVAQSIGGGGGASNVNLGAGALGDKTKGINIGVGGANGAAGSGALVNVDHVGAIFTHGDSSMGIKAQSIGGGGGSANAINQFLDPILDFATGQLDSASIGINIGRKGGTGGIGGEVRVKSDGSIHTDGDQSIGILAQSIGGGGGDSGTTTIGGDYTAKSGTYGGNLAIGIDGGTAATGGVVTVTSSGIVQTLGERAHAIFAQSLGGGGGMGGTVGDKLALSTGEDEDTTNADINIGGDGGDGSFSQQVTVDNSAMLLTYGDRSSGIWAQSIGGTGGTGGDFLLASIENIKGGKTSRSFAVNVGGSGGTGAVGGGVSVTNSGLIQTAGLQSFGIRAESIGGGGGDGGAVSQGSLVTGTGTKQSVNINVGGTGGDGGKGSLVEVTNEGIIHTRGLGADGIRATSTGGGGGNAGVIINTLLTLTGAESQTQSVAMNFGGNGGTGGTGGDVTVRNTRTAAERSGEIMTLGDSAHGVFAQSLGGGGGNGSSIISMTGLRNTEDSFAVGLNFGGTGGSGNFAGAVAVDSSGYISTAGKNAYGILAQSTGGGGGNGGLVIAAAAAFGQKANTPVLAIGGNGGDGGNGGKVDVTNTGTIQTTGAGSHGIVAQSIGGGGGNSGIGIAATTDKASFAISNLVSLIAGATGGGTGGLGGEVNVTQNGNITVTGEGAQAIMAESINGGGGHLDFDLSGVAGMPGFSFKDTFKDVFGITDADVVIDPKIATRLGGTDLSLMNASKVTITTKGDLGVAGDHSVGSFNQSLGGGGGTLFLKTRQADASSIGSGLTPTAISYQVNLGGANGTDNSGADIAARQEGSVLTTGFNTIGVLSQTIGGGGGHAIVDIAAEEGALVGPIDITLGSTNGSGENGGSILRDQIGDIATIQDLSTALLLQSIGGGGGSASIVLRGNGAVAASPPSGVGADLIAGDVADTPLPATGTLSLGASGGSDLNGGDIVSTSVGDVSTGGNHALGLIAQSIGAGGGEVRHSGTGSVNVDIGGKGGASGDGGKLTIRNSGDVQTTGAGGNAVFLQSIGGGGGAVFTDLAPGSVLVSLNSDNKGDGGAINFDQTGNIIAFGDHSIGVLAQSIGGGGGVVDRVFMDTAGGAGDSGSIALMLAGNIMADGLEGIGVFAQSRAAGNQGDIMVTLAADKMLSFGTDGAGVWLSGGVNNNFINKGIVAGIDGLLGWSVRGTEGNDAVGNEMTFLGQFDMGTGVNSFTNEAGALFIPGPQLLLGDASNLLTQNGTIQPGDMLNTQRSILTGSYIQTTTGVNFSELDFGSANPNVDGGLIDRIDATGTADLAGRMDITLLNPQLVPFGRFQKVLMSAFMGVTDSGMELTTAPSVVITYDLLYPTGFDAVLDYNVDFSPDGLGTNLREVGDYFNRIQAAGSSAELADTVVKLLYDPDMKTYRQSLSQMSPDFYGELQSEAIRGSQRFGGILLNGGPFRFYKDDYQLWLNFQSDSRTRDAFNDYKDFGSDIEGFSMGVQKFLTDEWSVGVGFAIESNSAVGYNGQWEVEDGHSERFGVSVKRNVGATEIGGILSYGRDEWDVTRSGYITSAFDADLRRQLETVGAILSVSHEFANDGAYIRPGLDLGYTYLMGNSGSEGGAGPLNLKIHDLDESHVWINPKVDLGYRFKNIFGSDVEAHLFGGVGLQQYLTDPETNVTAGLEGAPAGVRPMWVPVELDQTEIQTAIGIEFLTIERGSLSLQYGRSFSEHTDVDIWSLNMRVPF